MIQAHKERMQQRAAEEKRQEAHLAKLRADWRHFHATTPWTADQLRSVAAVEALIWQGIPANWRPLVWELLIGNSLGITAESFARFSERGGPAEGMNPQVAQVYREQILLDLPRTFPKLRIFSADGPMNADLLQVLEAFHHLRPDVGYVQGMSYVAGMLLMNMEKSLAFRCLAHVLVHPFHLGLYRMEAEALDKCFGVLEGVVRSRAPQLAAHFEAIGLTYDSFSLDWFLTIFSRSFPFEIAVLVWDLFVYYSTPILFRVACAVLLFLAPRLINHEFERCYRILSKLPVEWKPHDFLYSISQVQLTRSEIETILSIGL